MPIDPYPSETVLRKLKAISPRLKPKWNRLYKRWDILFCPEGRSSYVLHTPQEKNGSYRPIDGRTFAHLRYIFWLNRQYGGNIKRVLWDMATAQKYREEKLAQKEEDTIKYLAREVAPLLRQLARDTGYSAYTKPIPHVPGADFA